MHFNNETGMVRSYGVRIFMINKVDPMNRRPLSNRNERKCTFERVPSEGSDQTAHPSTDRNFC